MQAFGNRHLSGQLCRKRAVALHFTCWVWRTRCDGAPPHRHRVRPGQADVSARMGWRPRAGLSGDAHPFLPNHFRFGTGDATDRSVANSGRLDVVVEYPLVPSLPIVGPEKTRRYLAEGISVGRRGPARWSQKHREAAGCLKPVL